jgi:hypothetical protein
MHDEPLDRNPPSPAAVAQTAAGKAATDDLDQRLILALETVPELRIPADFAARVASQLPARRPVSLTSTHYGQNAMLLGIFATLAALIVLTLNTAGHASFGLLDSLLFAQFIAFTVWFSVWRYGLR